jgi:hypothetical protein
MGSHVVPQSKTACCCTFSCGRTHDTPRSASCFQGIAADVDVLPAPRIASDADVVAMGLGPLEQALLLGRAAQIKKVSVRCLGFLNPKRIQHALHPCCRMRRRSWCLGCSNDMATVPIVFDTQAAGSVTCLSTAPMQDTLMSAATLCNLLQGRAADELAGWEAAPFAEAVLRQRRSWPLPWAAAHLLKCVQTKSPACKP